jgi:trk system potassium uptake protein
MNAAAAETQGSASGGIRRRVPIALRLLMGLVLLVMIGTSLLMLPPMSTGEPLGFQQALFTAISALTVTGLSIITPGQDLTRLGSVVLLVLIQLGGVGYMVLAVTMFRLLGRRILLADRLALRDALGLISVQGVVDLVKYVVATVLTFEIIGAFLLWLNWRGGALDDGTVAFYAVFHSVSAFCNAGFELFSGLPDYRAGLPTDTATLSIMGTLIFLGGLGIPVLFDLITYPKRKQLSLHTRITIPIVLLLVFGGAFALFLSEGMRGGVLTDESLDRRFVLSTFQSLSARTAGFVGFPTFLGLEHATDLILMGLMFIGCAPASMGGGITTGTFAILTLALVAYARGDSTPIVGGKAIPGETIRKAAAVMTISLAVVFTSCWLILLTHDASLHEVMFEVVSAFATCGLSLGFTTELNSFGLFVIMVMMFWGRLGALTILVALTRYGPRRRVRYPEERVLIG